MKIRKEGLETFLYCLFCLCTFGSLYILRVIITAAIRRALKDE